MKCKLTLTNGEVVSAYVGKICTKTHISNYAVGVELIGTYESKPYGLIGKFYSIWTMPDHTVKGVYYRQLDDKDIAKIF